MTEARHSSSSSSTVGASCFARPRVALSVYSVSLSVCPSVCCLLLLLLLSTAGVGVCMVAEVLEKTREAGCSSTHRSHRLVTRYCFVNLLALRKKRHKGNNKFDGGDDDDDDAATAVYEPLFTHLLDILPPKQQTSQPAAGHHPI